MQKRNHLWFVCSTLLLMAVLASCVAPNVQPQPAAVDEPAQAEEPAVEEAVAEAAKAKAEEQIIAAATDTARDVARNPVPNAPEEAEEAVAEAPKTLVDYLPNLGPAPEVNNEIWINSDEPLRLEGLRGKVVLLEFWTFG